MPNLLRNVLALIAGIVIGGAVNMLLITLSPSLIPPPPGVDVNNAESLSKAIHLFEPRHFVMPFLAHAVGTLAGALAAYLIAATYRAQIAYVIGAALPLWGCGGKFHDSRAYLVHRAGSAGRLPPDGVVGYSDWYSNETREEGGLTIRFGGPPLAAADSNVRRGRCPRL